jgi:hypothetical protein
MNRVCDYCGFVVWFTGLGYLVLWLIGGTEHRLLPPALHGVGVLAATFVCVRLIVLAIKRWRVPVGGSAAALAGAAADAERQRPQQPARPLPTVKPRNHFGLRGTPD